MENDRTQLMSSFTKELDEIQTLLYKLLEFEETDYSEKKNLAKRKVLFAINEIRIQTENL